MSKFQNIFNNSKMNAMKTKNLLHFGILMIAALTLSLAGCKKSDTTTTKGKSDTESLQQLTKDENNIENVTDQSCDDARTEMSILGNKSTLPGGLCNATATFSGNVNDTLTIDIEYHGLNCNGSHYRTGHVIVKKRYSESWGQAGATVIMNLVNFTTTKTSTGKTLILNGTKHFQNVSGHFIWELDSSTVTSIQDKVWGSLTATFDDGSQRIWNIDRLRTFTGTLTQLVMTTDGLGVADGYTNLATWGTNRNSELFYSSITQSVVHKQVCDWNPCSGSIVHEIPAASKSSTISFGYDSNNNLITNGDCPTRYRIDWVVNGYSGTFFLPL
jgi:hypothetical protein